MTIRVQLCDGTVTLLLLLLFLLLLLLSIPGIQAAALLSSKASNGSRNLLAGFCVNKNDLPVTVPTVPYYYKPREQPKIDYDELLPGVETE